MWIIRVLLGVNDCETVQGRGGGGGSRESSHQPTHTVHTHCGVSVCCVFDAAIVVAIICYVLPPFFWTVDSKGVLERV